MQTYIPSPILHPLLVVQWIGCVPPKDAMQVRFLPRGLKQKTPHRRFCFSPREQLDSSSCVQESKMRSIFFRPIKGEKMRAAVREWETFCDPELVEGETKVPNSGTIPAEGTRARMPPYTTPSAPLGTEILQHLRDFLLIQYHL